MYLCDSHLRQLLPEIQVVAEDGAEPFRPDDQVQPSSIDLRLSAVFWRPLRRFTIDLRRPRLLEVHPRRYYRKVVLGTGETILLRPFELLLGRTLEEFSVPNGYAAELTGRSSFSRLGLMVNATGGYINPGWRGRMPLQLVNFGPNPIRLVAGLPICQVRFARLTDLAARPYGDPALQSTYLDDDGGPSYWWRDKRIKTLHTLLAERLVEERIQRALYSAIGPREPEVIERLEQCVARTRMAEVHNAEALLEDFAASEERRRGYRRLAINLSRGSFTVGITASLWVANKLPPVQWWHVATWCGAICLATLSVYAFRSEVGDHFGTAELRASRRDIGNGNKR
jgi:deoxycytidine triphosphate deaminase